MSFGFVIDLKGSKIVGYLLLAATLFKVVANDLSALSNPMRSIVFLLLGGVMLLAGTVAIRTKRSAV